MQVTLKKRVRQTKLDIKESDTPLKRKRLVIQEIDRENQQNNTKLHLDSMAELKLSNNDSKTREPAFKTRQCRNSAKSDKKLIIKPFKVKPKLSSSFFDDTIARLCEAVDAIHNKTNVSDSLEELYRSTQDLCIHKKSAELYHNLKEKCDEHVLLVIKSLYNQTDQPIVFLQLIQSSWLDHCAQMLIIRGIFLYLDRTYTIQTSNVYSVYNMGLHIFCKHFQENNQVERKTIQFLLNLIESERKGENIDRILMKNIIGMLIALEIYKSIFEVEFLFVTTSFYHEEGEKLVRQLSISDYTSFVFERLKQENERILYYLDPSTKRNLIATTEEQLVKVHVNILLENGFDNLISTSQNEILKRIYTLFSSVDALKQLEIAFEKYIEKTGSDIVLNEEKDTVMVQELLDFKTKLDTILSVSFQNNQEFQYALKRAFESFINRRQNKPAEFVAKFIDKQLRRGMNKSISEDELEQILDSTITIFRFIHGKDVFEAFYKKDLAKRLLLNKSSSEDAEILVVSKLKLECGPAFTNKIEGMFKDIELSRDVMQRYSQWRKEQDSLSSSTCPESSSAPINPTETPFEMMAHVLTTSCWPEYAPVDIKLDDKIIKEQEMFQNFYFGISGNNGRKLSWINSFAHCILGARFKNGRKELAVSAFQAVVLTLFNKKETISYSEIKEMSGICDSELKRTLLSLISGKTKESRLLLKKSKGREIGDNDFFRINKDFQSKFFRVKINSIQAKESKEENVRTNDKIFQDRQ